MTTTKTTEPHAEDHALQVFEERNRAFRVLFDTVMEVEGASDEAVFVILCRNLLRLCSGVTAALATYHPGQETMTLECACQQLNGGEVSLLNQPGITARVTEETVENFRKKQVQQCDRHRGCLVDIFSGSALGEMRLSQEGNCYRLSCVRDGELIVGGMVQLKPGTRLKIKDMIDTYLNLAGLIIQRIYMHRSLRESEGRLRTFFDSMQHGLLLIDAETHRIVDVNPSAAGMIGAPEDEIIGAVCHQFVCPWEVGQCPITDLGKGVEQAEKTMVTADGSEVPILKTVTPITLNGRPHLLESFIDITERKQKEEMVLRHSLVYRSMQEAVMIFDRQDIIIDTNQATEKVLGWSRDELLGKKASILNPPNQMEDIVTGIRRGLDKHGAWEGELPIVTRSGELRTMSTIVSSIYDLEGNWIGNVGINRDITERKEAELALRESQERFRIAAECASDLIYEWDLASDTLKWYGDIDKTLGYESGEIPGTIKAWLALIHPDDAERMTEEVADLRETGKPLETEYRIRHRDGHWLYWLERGTPIFDEDGRSVKVIGVCTDITDRRRLEGEQVKSQKLESLGILAGGIAHDFNNLLMSIMGNISLARLNQPVESDLGEILAEVEASCAQAKNLTQQLLTFSRGGKPVKKTTVISNLIRESTGLALSGTSSRAAFSIAEDLWPVNVDPGQLQQVINNLIINAAQAMPDGGTIEVGAENIEIAGETRISLKPGKYVMLSIRDSGIGITKKFISRIYDPYFTTKQQGSGLGLATVYSIIRNHNGLITVKSEPGKGTTFSIYLPAVAALYPDRENPQPSEKITTGKGRILIMDDDDMVRKVMGRMIGHLGYEVVESCHGDEAVEKFLEAREAGRDFNAVILDLTIKNGMGGEDTARELKKLDGEVKLIVSSGYSTSALMAEHEKYGFIGVISKPYRLKDLSELLSQVIR